LLDVRWSSGRLLREYTVLLDPPLFEANVVQPAATPAQTAVAAPTEAEGQVDRTPVVVAEAEVIEATGLFQLEPEVETPPAAELAAEEEPAVSEVVAEAEPEPEPVVEEEPVSVAPAYVAPVRNTPYEEMAPADAMPDSYTTQRGDTLWRIAERVRDGSGLSNNQMMLALYRANPDAFMGNINRLKAGAVMRIPAEVELEAPGVAEANSEVVEQNAAWNESRGQESRLQLVAPAETDSSAEADAADGLAEADTSMDSAEAEGAGVTEQGEVAAATDESATAGAIDEEVAEDERLLEVEDAELQALQERIDEQEQVSAEAEETEAQIFADTDAPADGDEVTDETVGAAPAEESSFLGGLLGSLWFWGAAALVILIAVGLARARKSEPEDDVAASDDWAEDIDEPGHDETVRDFGDLDSATDAIVVEEGEGPAMFADDPDATHANLSAPDHVAAPADELQDFADGSTDAPFAESFDEPADDVLGDDLDFRVDADDIFAAPEPQDDIAPVQEVTGQDEVELPLEKTISTGAPLNLDQADPIAEAEFHMAYGLYDQAAELLVRALEETPDNRLYRVKLIEVYFVWENKEGFLEQAQALRGSVSDDTDSDWNKVLILGKQLCPDDALFSGSDAAIQSADLMDLELSDVGETEIDFTLGGNEVQVLDLELGSDADSDSGSDGDLDMDFGGALGESESDDELTLNLGDADEATMESPTVESPGADLGFGDADSDSTMESPTMESPTVESPGVDLDFGEFADDSTMESPTIENPMDEATQESPTLEAFGSDAETTEMPGLEDPSSLEVDLSGLTDLPVESDELGDIGEADIVDSDAFTTEHSADHEDQPTDQEEPSVSSMEQLDEGVGEIDLGSDTGEVSDTIEQPSVDAAIGDTAEQPVLDDLIDTGLADESGEAWSLPEDATMTEVGTKLDLARAYIDMGDPDGARSILNEVLDEGEDSQLQEARQLLAELDD